MDLNSLAAGLAIGLAVAAAAWLVGRASAQRELASAQQDRARLAAELDGERRSAAEKLALLDEARAALKDSFGALSASALQTNNEAFLQLAKLSLEKIQQASHTDLEGRQKEIAGLVEPMRESLSQISEHIKQVDRDGATTAQALTTQLRSMGDAQERLRRETEGLVRALKSPNQRGRWGEVQLRNVIERAGMAEVLRRLQREGLGHRRARTPGDPRHDHPAPERLVRRDRLEGAD